MPWDKVFIKIIRVYVPVYMNEMQYYELDVMINFRNHLADTGKALTNLLTEPIEEK